MDQTMGLILSVFIVAVAVLAPIIGADSRPGWQRVDRKPRFRMCGSMRREDWPPSEFDRR
jgi:hypothetical protein